MRILIGEPVKGTAANALRRLDQAVKDLDGLLLANFYVGPRQFDFVLVLPEYTVLIELKSLAGAAFGGQNGNWSIRDLTGEKREYPGLNPGGQAVAQANVLSDEMSRFQKARQNVPAPLNGQFYREFETIACIYPTLHTDSKIEITTFKAKLVGFDDLTSSGPSIGSLVLAPNDDIRPQPLTNRQDGRGRSIARPMMGPPIAPGRIQ
jgi:hypothetical protein